jgi:hypothetical protein
MFTVAIEFKAAPGKTKRHVLLPARHYEQAGRSFDVTVEHIEQMAAGFSIRRPVTIAHPDLASAEAVGWIVALSVGQHDGAPALVADIEWLGDTAAAIEARRYGFISPVFSLEHKDEAGRDVGAKLVAAGVTNSPHWSSDQPELWAAFCAALGDTNDAADAAREDDDMKDLEQAKARVQELEASVASLTADKDKLAAALEAQTAEVAKFAAQNDEHAKLRDQVRQMRAEQRIAKMSHKLLDRHLTADGKPTELALAALEDSEDLFAFMCSLIPEPVDNTTQVGGQGSGETISPRDAALAHANAEAAKVEAGKRAAVFAATYDAKLIELASKGV